MVRTCFGGNDCATINIFGPNMFWWNFFVRTCFEEMILQSKKNFQKQILIKFFVRNRFLRKWFCSPKKFSTKKILMKIFGMNLFSRKWVCNHKKFSNKNFLVRTYFRGNDFATIKNFRPKLFNEKFWLEPVFEEIILQP